MKNITTTLTTDAIFSDDGHKRYLLKKVWNTSKPSLGIIMLVPSEASGIELDSTTALVINNTSRLEYGSVSIANLFSTIGDHKLLNAEFEDRENIKNIVEMANAVDTIVYAAGVGKISNKAFIKRQNQVLDVLKPYENKLKCLTNSEGTARCQHPLSPAVRYWVLSDLKVAELYYNDSIGNNEGKRKKK